MRTAVSNWLYNRGPARYYQPAYRHIARGIGLKQGRFLDIGCGPGWLGIRVAEQAPETEVFGVDLSARMLGFARGHAASLPNVRFEQMDAAQMRFADGFFSAAAAVQSAHHWQDVPRILSEAHRVLQPGGRFLIYEADRHAAEVPADWIDRRLGWPTDRVVRLGWRRFGMDELEWAALNEAAHSSAFTQVQDDRHGFYRLLVLTR